MRIHEIGIIVNGIPVVYVRFNDFGSFGSQFIHSTGIIPSLLIFSERMLIESVEYIESEKYCIIFLKKVLNKFSTKSKKEIIIYSVINKELEFDKLYKEKVLKTLKRILKKFIVKHRDSNVNNLTIFKEFEDLLRKSFEIESKVLEDRVASIFV